MLHRLASLLGLRHSQDMLSIAVMAAYPCFIYGHYQIGAHGALSFITCIYAYVIGCLQHCHGHQPMFKARFLNRVIETLFVLFRFDGCNAWKATHNGNHHRFANREGDMTLTYRFTARNGFIPFLLYLGHGTVAYVRASVRYLLSLLFKPRTPASFRLGCLWLMQIMAWCAATLWLWNHDAQTTIYAVWIPQGFGVLAMVGTGYFQHHHTQTGHPYNSSRNFISPWLNLITFNHGYHLVHHRHIAMHWSQWPREHKRIEHLIDPSLNEKSLAYYFLKVFVLQHFSARFRTTDLNQTTGPSCIPSISPR